MNDKKWELIVEATAFDGSQTFACEAKDEEEALAKFKAGLCEIIEVNVEVVELSSIPMDIEESDCIKSRLSGDLNAELTEENKQLREFVGRLSRSPIHAKLGTKGHKGYEEHLSSSWKEEAEELLNK